MPRIVFGTDGWRARIAEEYTFDAVRICSQAVAEWVRREGGAERGVVIGYDRRFASEHFAAAAAQVVAANGVRVQLSTTAAPTQSFSWATMKRKAKAGIVITASHNPWYDNGFKVKTESGAAAPPDMLKALEAIIHPLEERGERIDRVDLDDARTKGLVETFDPAPDYLARVGELLDLEAFRHAGYTVVCEPLFGSASGYFPRLIGGGRTKLVELHAERNPYFGGVNPEPIPPNINEFLARIPAEKAHVGLAVDGDADRAGLADETGRFITTLTTYALLMWYLVEVRKLRQPVVKTVNITSMVDVLGKKYGVAVHEVPVGFKYVGAKMQETGAMMGGEESGGFGFAMHMPERDGIFADLLVLDLMLKMRKSPSELVAELMDLAGPSAYLRRDVHFDRAEYPRHRERIMAALEEAVRASGSRVQILSDTRIAQARDPGLVGRARAAGASEAADTGRAIGGSMDVGALEDGHDAVRVGHDLRVPMVHVRQQFQLPTELAGIPVSRAQMLDTKDGAKFFRDDGSWLLVRLSGTEPLVRVYAETKSDRDLAPLLDAGERLIGAK